MIWCDDDVQRAVDLQKRACVRIMMYGLPVAILGRLSHRGSVAASKKACTGRHGSLLWLGSDLGGMAVSPNCIS